MSSEGEPKPKLNKEHQMSSAQSSPNPDNQDQLGANVGNVDADQMGSSSHLPLDQDLEKTKFLIKESKEDPLGRIPR